MFTFKRALPEEAGLCSADIEKVLRTLDNKNVPMHSLIIMKNDRIVFEKYYAPYKEDTLHRMFSISKSFSAVAVALLREEGKIDFDDPIIKYFPEYVDESTHPWIRMMTIRNMLMMRTCHASTTYKVNMKSDWVESFFKVTPTHKPGTVFHYDTSAAHVLCALVEKLSGTDMLTYMKGKMLCHVDFSENSYMVKDPFGVSMGGSGLMATPMDVFKFLYILANNGRITCSDGQIRQLIPEDFVREATSNLSDNYVTGPLPSETQGYGMQIWQNEKGGFVLYGMGGQLAISIPGADLLVMTTADTQGMQGGNQIIYDAIYDNLLGSECAQDLSGDETVSSSEVPSQPSDAYRHLIEYADTLRIFPPRLPENYAYTGTGATRDIMRISADSAADRASLERHTTSEQVISGSTLFTGGTYKLDPNKQGFEALSIELPKDAYSKVTSEPYKEASSEAAGGSRHGDSPCRLTFRQNNTLHTIAFKIGAMCEGLFPIYNIPYTAGGMWSRDNVLYIRAHLIGECVGSVHFELYFEEGEVTVFMRKIEETCFSEFEGHLHGLLS
ncbi:MAG: beta-lactamase family protein [Butyrivibrio sp.]|nr:beta-lactamase family protein [Butyrivibrio sp.]